MQASIASHPAIFDIHDNLREPLMTIGIELDLARVAASGTTPQQLTLALSSMLDGLPATHYREDNDLIAVVMRNNNDQRYNLDRLQTLQVPVGNGKTVALSELARFDYRFEPSIVWHHNAFNSITVLVCVSSFVMRSASMMGIVKSWWKKSETRLFPHPIPPVRPTTNIVALDYLYSFV